MTIIIQEICIAAKSLSSPRYRDFTFLYHAIEFMKVLKSVKKDFVISKTMFLYEKISNI